jgi:hypothetical protein
LISAILIAACVANPFHGALADQATPSAVKSPSGQTWHLSYGFVGKKVPLCRAILQEAKRQLQSEGGLCTFPIRPDDRRFGTVEWKRLSPEESLAPFKKFFAWFMLSSNYLSPQSATNFLVHSGPSVLSSESIEDLWRRYSRNIPELIGSGELQVEATTLLVDGTPIQAYRTTDTFPETYPDIGAWKTYSCKMPNGKSRPQTHLFFPQRDDRWYEFKLVNFTPSSGDVVIWNKRAYVGWAGTGGISLRGLIIVGGQLGYTESVCEITIEGE